ncbi:hypothetical protein [Cryobacterium psychrophilum]|uniref:Uncharacterized protein n=1 Tax=Cryobacterium psychrophilum TaxID=41988 RepID=A0A4Y8KTB1_9MICO|nr:hypothetical protein [Cryobacterium psychrophilum]TDW30996.1 hypothetical protein EDD25_2784 [Cryobacterium psychrophilum]TFD80857.1 hypothetical protein E3T53_04335 [Cryobacterium psychrophilum]
MDTGYTFSTQKGVRLMLYVLDGVEPPREVVCTVNGEAVTFFRVSDRSLECDPKCTSRDCHRARLGDCLCGRHEKPVRFAKAAVP